MSKAGKQTALKQLILWGPQGWQVEQGDQQMKEAVGLDDYEGRSWRGLPHHLPQCLMASGFLRLEEARKKSRIDGGGRETAPQGGVEVDNVWHCQQCTSGAPSTAL